jgi:uncharacterized protein (DUF362 family)/Pyruvate/2-oxoacid:ferredoxin oxidoreductase delta subunit
LVVLKKCSEYKREEVLDKIKAIFDGLGGLDKYIRPGMTVAIKPNLVAKRKPEIAATTHPEVVYSVCKLVKDLGATPIIVESPGGLYSEHILKWVYQVCGIAKAAEDAGAVLNFDTSCKEVESPEGKYLKKITILKPIAEADAVINLSKLKTHGMMVLSAAVKNMFGAIPGLDKPEYHFRMSDYDDFANCIIDIFLSTKVTLNIIDGIVAMEGEGPTSGEPRQMGVLLGSADAFALDVVAANIIGANPASIPILKNSIQRGLCSGRLEDIKIIGDSVENVQAKDYDIPQLGNLKTLEFTENKFLRYFTKRIKPKPVFHHDKCASCGDCVRLCPAHIIQLDKGRKPRFDSSKCISCFCCQELCPVKAVSIKRPLIMKLALKKKTR